MRIVATLVDIPRAPERLLLTIVAWQGLRIIARMFCFVYDHSPYVQNKGSIESPSRVHSYTVKSIVACGPLSFRLGLIGLGSFGLISFELKDHLDW